jgi:hypothetical protein
MPSTTTTTASSHQHQQQQQQPKVTGTVRSKNPLKGAVEILPVRYFIICVCVFVCLCLRVVISACCAEFVGTSGKGLLGLVLYAIASSVGHCAMFRTTSTTTTTAERAMRCDAYYMLPICLPRFHCRLW